MKNILFELWFDICDFSQSNYILTLIHRIFISIVLLISSKRSLQIYGNTEYMIFVLHICLNKIYIFLETMISCI